VTSEAALATVQARPLAELVGDIKRALAGVPGGWVEAEVLQATRKGPHCYVSLSGGEDVRVDAKFFGHACTRAEESLGGPIEAGQRLLVRVDRPDFYAPYGRLSLLCSDARHVGEGELLRRRRVTVERLEREGLVGRPRRPLPRFPRKVGLVCGDPSDAFHDVVGSLADRFPAAGVVFCPSPVQGLDAPAALIRAILTLNEFPGVDVIVVARGGGSVADLAAFDDEELCRIAARSPVPVVAAVGHTANRPVIYQVAEATASVPREVATVVVPAREELEARLDRAASDRTRHGRVVRESEDRVVAAARRLRAQSTCLDAHAHSLAASGRRLDDVVREFHGRCLEALARAAERRRAVAGAVPRGERLDAARARLEAVCDRTDRDALAALRELEAIAGRRRRAAAGRVASAAERAATVVAGIRAHDPAARGYAVVRAGSRVMRRVRDLRPGQRATIVFCDGHAEAAVESIHPASPAKYEEE
jgi:exodeoxyribonuclease VII large subunit